jgi:anti-sigma factor RsiW
MSSSNTALSTDPALLVHAYLDNELDPANALAVARQIETDPALAAEATRTEALRSALRDRLPLEPPPAHLRARIDAAVGLSRSASHWSSHPTWRALAASVVMAMVLASGSTWLAVRPASDRGVATAVIDSHIRALMAPQPADIMSSERHTVKPWFNGRIPTSPRVVDLAPEGFPLIGGRVDVIGTTPTPTLVYGRRKHVISLLAVPDQGATEGTSVTQSIKGYNVVGWRQNQIAYWAISDLNAAELETFAQKFRAAP